MSQRPRMTAYCLLIALILPGVPTTWGWSEPAIQKPVEGIEAESQATTQGTTTLATYLPAASARIPNGAVAVTQLHTRALGNIDLRATFPAGASIPSNLSAGLSLVQFARPITETSRVWMDRLGDIVGYFPEHGYLIWGISEVAVPPIRPADVLWLGALPPVLKVDPALHEWLAEQSAPVRVVRHETPNLLDLTVHADSTRWETLDLDEIMTVAADPHVQWLEPAYASVPQLASATTIIDARGDDGPMSPPELQLNLWTWDDDASTNGAFDGEIGEGYIIAIAELDEADCSHPDFADRKHGASYECGADDHATGVVGAAIGDGVDSGRQHIGSAPGATFLLQNGGSGSFQSNCAQAYNVGARIQSNSWTDGIGLSGAYVQSSHDADECIRNVGTGDLIIFAANGNFPDVQKPIAPANAKNIISVGTSGNEAAPTFGDPIYYEETTSQNHRREVRASMAGSSQILSHQAIGSQLLSQVAGTNLTSGAASPPLSQPARACSCLRITTAWRFTSSRQQ